MVTSRTQRHTPTRDELRIWREFRDTIERLNAQLASRLQQDSALSPGDYTVMLALTEAEGRRIRSSELAAEIGWERSRLSHHLGRMEQRGLIRREVCAEDTRGSEIVLTDDGFTAFRRATIPHLIAVRERFIDPLTADDLATIARLTATWRDRLDEVETT